MKKSTVVFIGGLENGRKVVECLLDCDMVHLAAVYTYADDVHMSKPFGVLLDDLPVGSLIKVKDIDDEVALRIREIEPDLIFVAGWSRILSAPVLSAARLGCIGFHPSKLPRDRGRSVLAWQIAEGYQETALSMFYLTETVDAGDLIAQERIRIDESDYVADILEKVNKATENLMRTYLPLILAGKAPRVAQDHTRATYRRLRVEKDGEIDWDRPAVEIYNLVRAIAPPYPCAHTYLCESKLKVTRSRVVNDLPERYWYGSLPGTILGVVSSPNGREFLIATRDLPLAIAFDGEPEAVATLNAIGKRLGKR